MKQYIFLLLPILACFGAAAQDAITTTLGDNIPCKVLRTTKKSVKYRLTVGDTSVLSMPIQSVASIAYGTGEKDIYNESKVDDNDDEGKWNKDMMAEQGEKDAKGNYSEYKGPKTVTAVVAALTGPIIGLVPAVVYTSSPPETESLDCPDPELMKDKKYLSSYRSEARKIRNRKVWNGYIVGTVIDIAAFVLILAL